ncbi:DUF3284 domain-containing protein [Clostridium sp.]|uniref:DUF3284 domain-containing protein n=1 Tax=Clostridium sp. TaxID=1506 RepID=UPI002FC9C685
MSFKNSAELDYPVEEVFKVFMRSAKKDFPKFNEKNPIGTSVTKKGGAYAGKSVDMNVEITDYKENELYQITSVRNKLAFVSTYKFERIDDNKCIFGLEESDSTAGIFKGLNAILQNFLFKKRITKRFQFLIQGLEYEMKNYREMINKNAKKENKVTL